MRFWEYPLNIQAYDSTTNTWSEKKFETKKEHISYIEAQFKTEPQFYKLKNTAKWQEAGAFYTKTQKESGKLNFEGGRYHDFRKNSPAEVKWRNTEKDRMKNGVIYDDIFVPGFYYFYINYCPIFDDVLAKKRFADVWDGDLWYMQYVMLAILKGRHVGGVKGRQKGYSYKHMAILYWCYMWFESTVNTVGGYLEDLIKKSWRYLEGYRAHLNAHTVWKRGPVEPKSLLWEEKSMTKANIPKGLLSKLAGVTFKQREDNDVGGPQTFFNYEEPGLSPTILGTLEFIRPAVEKGSLTTGTMIACGSVGKLEDAEGMKEIFYKPRDYNFLPVKNVWDTKSEECCIFISEAYNMIGADDDEDDPESTGRPFMDKDGNSDVELSLRWIRRKKEQLKKSKKKAHLKKLAESQKCTTPQEAFDERSNSEWPVAKMRLQQERIQEKWDKKLWEFEPIKGLMEEKLDGSYFLNPNPEGGLPQEHQWPINPEWDDKRGVACMFEPPVENPAFYTYFACVDAVEVDETSTSESVASLSIYKRSVRVLYTDEKGMERSRIEGDKLVYSYNGRFKTPDETNEQMWMAIKIYNAFCYPERNKPNFINWMKRNGHAHFLAKEGDVPMFKDMNTKAGSFENNSKYGFHTGDKTEIWKLFKATAKEYFQTEYGTNQFNTKTGEEVIIAVYTGINRIDDYWLLEEFCNHMEGKNGNFDRMISFMGSLFIAKTWDQNLTIPVVDERKQKEKKEEYRPPKSKMLIGGGGMRINRPRDGRPRKPKSML